METVESINEQRNDLMSEINHILNIWEDRKICSKNDFVREAYANICGSRVVTLRLNTVDESAIEFRERFLDSVDDDTVFVPRYIHNKCVNKVVPVGGFYMLHHYLEVLAELDKKLVKLLHSQARVGMLKVLPLEYHPRIIKLLDSQDLRDSRNPQDYFKIQSAIQATKQIDAGEPTDDHSCQCDDLV
jgi:hypothetical protein